MSLYDIIDSRELQLEIKGCSTQFQARLCIFTTNYHPKTWYPNLVVAGFSGGFESADVGPSDDYGAFWRWLSSPTGAVRSVQTREEIEYIYKEYGVQVPEEPELALDTDTLPNFFHIWYHSKVEEKRFPMVLLTFVYGIVPLLLAIKKCLHQINPQSFLNIPLCDFSCVTIDGAGNGHIEKKKCCERCQWGLEDKMDTCSHNIFSKLEGQSGKGLQINYCTRKNFC